MVSPALSLCEYVAAGPSGGGGEAVEKVRGEGELERARERVDGTGEARSRRARQGKRAAPPPVPPGTGGVGLVPRHVPGGLHLSRASLLTPRTARSLRPHARPPASASAPASVGALGKRFQPSPGLARAPRGARGASQPASQPATASQPAPSVGLRARDGPPSRPPAGSRAHCLPCLSACLPAVRPGVARPALLFLLPTTSDQTWQPAEFKHITKRRKRN